MTPAAALTATSWWRDDLRGRWSAIFAAHTHGIVDPLALIGQDVIVDQKLWRVHGAELWAIVCDDWRHMDIGLVVEPTS